MHRDTIGDPAGGKAAIEAYRIAGYRSDRGNASRLQRKARDCACVSIGTPATARGQLMWQLSALSGGIFDVKTRRAI
jgi:hypothetical protein